MSFDKFPFRCLLLSVAGAAAILLPTLAIGASPKGKAPAHETGLRIWVDGKGVWHFVSHTNPGHVHVFSGAIRVSGAKIRGALGIDKLEKGDYWRINGATNTVAFRLTTNGKWDRIDLVLNGPAKEVTFNLKEDGKPMKLSRVHVGKAGKNPKDMPFTLPGK
jgi:hypothetical protein